ncbi:hypothetical protein H0H92_010482, partial [Tricholoma furcatifolium]
MPQSPPTAHPAPATALSAHKRAHKHLHHPPARPNNPRRVDDGCSAAARGRRAQGVEGRRDVWRAGGTRGGQA